MLNRRDFLKMSGLAVGASMLPPGMSKVFASIEQDLPKWQQFKGESIRVLTENTPPSLGIQAAGDLFTKLTGMNVHITMDSMDALKEKMFLDLRGGDPEYHVNYAQPRPIGCVVVDYWEPVNTFIDIETGKSVMSDMPDVPGVEGKLADVFLPAHVDHGCIYFDRSIWYALPYDTAQGIMFYRQDIFDKYGKQYEDQAGKPLKLGSDVTWDEFYDMCVFLKKNCKEVDAPFALHYAQNWPIASEWASLLIAFGVMKEGFSGIEDYLAGQKNPGPYFSNKDDYAKGIETLEFMKKLQNVMHPDVMIWEWGGLGTGYATGKVAIQRNCGEFCPFTEDPKVSVAAGKTGYAAVPKGKSGINAYEMGASGLAVPNALPMKEKKKAWLYVMWASSVQAQWEAFVRYYGTPVRKANYDEARKRGWLEENSDFRKAQHLRVQEYELNNCLDGFSAGPKIPTYSEYLDIVGGELSKWCAGETAKPQACLDKMISRLNRLHGV